MPVVSKVAKLPDCGTNAPGIGWTGFKSHGLNWSNRQLVGQDFTRRAGQQAIKGEGGSWFGDSDGVMRKGNSKSSQRKAASALIAKIPLPLSTHIARTFLPAEDAASAQPGAVAA